MIIWVVLFVYVMAATLALTVLAGFVAIGLLWSGLGWADEERLTLMGSVPRYQLTVVGPAAVARPVRSSPRARLPLPPPPAPSLTGELKRLSALHDSGVLTDEEFAAGKAKLVE